MHAREEVLGKQVAERNNFIVPLWQRRYSWTKPQWMSFWDDVVRQYVAKNDTPRHFIGSLILHAQEKEHVSNPTPVVVVDGQQRLLTVLVLLAAIRDHLLAVDQPSAAESFELYLFNSQADGLMRYRLVPQESDREAFFSIMDGRSVVENAAESDEPAPSDVLAPEASDDPEQDVDDEEDVIPAHVVGDAYRFFRERITTTPWESALDPDRLVTAIVDRLEIVAITLGAGDSYHRIFQTVNAEGVELRDVDLVRNYLFMLLGNGADSAYTKHWRPMEDRLNRSFTNFLVAKGQPASAQRKSVFSGYRRQLAGLENNPGSISSVLQRLESDSRDFARVLAEDDQVDSAGRAVESRLRFLREWGSVPLQALLFRLVVTKDLPEDDLDRALQAIESLVVRRFLRRTPPNDLRSRFNAITLKTVETKPDVLVSRIIDNFMEEAARWPSDEDVRAAVEQVAVYDKPRARQTFLVLKRLSSRVQGKEFPKHVRLGREVGSYQVEHVLPQDPKKWLADLSTWEVEDIPAFLASRTHTLPNLALTAYNPDMGNAPFAEKKELLAKSSIELTREIADLDRWAVGELTHRATRLSDLVIAEWPRA